MDNDHNQTSPHCAIDVRGLYKSYGSKEAIRGIELRVAPGEVFALLGPNGAGKTTIVEILEGHRSRSAGQVVVLGHDPRSNDRTFKQRLGIVLQSTSVDQYLSVEEAIDQFRGYYPNPLSLDELLDLVGLREERGTRVKKLSGGQQRRLDVAIGLAGDPELLFLDEPTTGFDPSARRVAWEMVKGLKSLGKTVLLTTHYMEEAEYLADRVAILVQGKIVVEGVPGELALRDRTTAVRFRLPDGAAPLPSELQATSTADGIVSLATASPTSTLHQLTTWAMENDIELEDLTVSHPTLEDLFIELVSKADGSGRQT